MTARTYAPRDASHYSHRASRRTRPAGPPAPRPNRYGGKCTLCGNWVAEGAGVAIKPADRWVVQHNADECPAPAPKVALPKPALGYYIRKDGAAIKVVESKRDDEEHGGKRHYGLVFTPSEVPGKRPAWLFVKGAGISVADMRPMTASDAALLGLSHGHCIFCCRPLGGETLSAHVSALIGYGETCAGNEGLPYPKGKRAQEDFIDSHQD